MKKLFYYAIGAFVIALVIFLIRGYSNLKLFDMYLVTEYIVTEDYLPLIWMIITFIFSCIMIYFIIKLLIRLSREKVIKHNK